VNLRSQRDNESVDNFIIDLYCLAEYCEFGRILVGLKDKKLLEQLQATNLSPGKDTDTSASVDHICKGKDRDDKGRDQKKPPKPRTRLIRMLKINVHDALVLRTQRGYV